MAILAFQKPDKVVMLEANDKFGRFEFRPLEPGFGVTIGNSLRRILLSSLEGFSINTVRIAGVEHEFSSVPGVKEDVTNIILNLKQVRFKQVVEEFENEKVSITVENTTEFKAGDIGKYLTGFEVLNSDLVICHLDAKASLQIDLTINKGRGYVPADENREFCTDVNVIPIDSIYTPIRNVRYSVEPYRVEQKTDYDKLVIDVTTDGSISPKDALKEAAKILIYHFMLFSDEKIAVENQDVDTNEEFDEGVAKAVEQAINGKYEDSGIDHYINIGLANFKGKNFREVYEIQCKLRELTGGKIEPVFNAVQRCFRGTGELPNNKDLAYYNGANRVWKHIEDHIDDIELFDQLFLSGKIDYQNKQQEQISYEARTKGI